MKTIFLLLLILSSAHAVAQSEAPKFEDFAASPSRAKLTRIDFASHEQGDVIKERLEYHVGEPVNYAGHYRLAIFGCGTMCQTFAAIQVSSGKIVDLVTASFGGCFKPDSQLLILNPDLASNYGDQIPGWANTIYYRITPFGFKELYKTKESYTGPCPSGD